MGGVLNALASYVTKMLADMAREEVAMMIGVTGKIDDMSVKLGDLKNFLADADRRKITDESVQGWVEELKRAMYHATDILDLCQLKFMEHGASKDMGCFNPLLFCMRNPLHAHDIGSRIKELNKKLDDICTRGRSFDFIKLEAYQDRKMTRPPVVNRKTDPVLERSAVVGEKIEEDTERLVEMLTKDVAQESCNIMVFAIVGVGGIGKTTLSKKVFNNESIQGNFAKKIWLSITQDFNEVDILRSAITAADGNMPGSSMGGSDDKALLVPALASAIKDKKFFLVLDDMWGDNEWNRLLKAPFSQGATGSRVLVTTRHDTVARGMKAIVPYHHIEKLRPQDSWLLLKKQVLTCDKGESDIDALEDIGLQIIEKCDGLPLAVKVMGGLLCRREKHRRGWEDVLNDTRWSVSRMPEELSYAIYLSYEDLPPGLKQCFLYFSLKPKNTIFGEDTLVAMWISEGFVHGDSDGLEKLGKEYYKELVVRNLIEPDGRLGNYFCNMHDVLRSFAQFVARDEALTTHKGGGYNVKLSSQRFLRLSIEIRGVSSNDFEWRSLQVQKSLRTLFLVGNLKFESGDSLISFSSLRVLHIESTTFGTLLESLYQLKHLRYLAVQNCIDMNRLPENIDKLKFLQHISLEGCASFLQLPSSIVKLPGLRYLNLNDTCVNNVPRDFCVLTDLRFLNGFPSYMDGDWCSLEELAPLSLLEDLALYGLENITDSSFAAKASLGAKVHLAALGLCCTSRVGQDGLVQGSISEEEERVIQEVFDELCPLPCLEYLHIKGYFGRQLPRWMMLAAPEQMPLNNLRFLILESLACCTQLPDSLCRLPYLEYISVYQAPAIMQVGPEFVQPQHHRDYASSQTSAAFPRLRNMMLDGMLEWEEWEWVEEVQAMPALEELFIQSCKLRYIPPGLAFHARSLKKLTLSSVEGLQSMENFASVVELDLYNIPYLTKISNFPKLQKLQINRCPELESLQEMTALRRLVLALSYSEKRLPLFLQTVKPRHLLLYCRTGLLASMASGKSGPEWNKFSHIPKVEAFSNFEGIEKRWHVFYTSDPYNMETNLDLQNPDIYNHLAYRPIKRINHDKK